MGLSGSKPLQFNFRDIFEKVRCYSACCGGQVTIEEHEENEHDEYEDIDADNIESEIESDSDTASVATWV